jgi:hypothetical protein
MSHSLKLTLAVVAMAVLGSNAPAQFITVPNGSFENPSTSPPVAGNGDYFQVNNNNSTFVPDWTFNDPSSVSGTLSNRFANIGNPGTSDGSRVGFFNVGSGATGTATTNSPVTTISGSSTYVLTVSIGNTPGTGNFNDPGTAVLNIFAQPATGPMILIGTNSINADTITDGTIQDLSATVFAPTAALYAGDGLYLQIEGVNTETNGESTQLLFDNVRLEAVPEPGTWALMLGGLGLLYFVRRRTARA